MTDKPKSAETATATRLVAPIHIEPARAVSASDAPATLEELADMDVPYMVNNSEPINYSELQRGLDAAGRVAVEILHEDLGLTA